MRPFVLLIVFFGITIVVLGTLSSIQRSNMVSGLEIPDVGIHAIAGWNYTMKEPVEGIEYTWANTVDSLESAYYLGEPIEDDTHQIYYTVGGAPTDRGSIWTYIVRNNTWDPYFTYNLPAEINAAVEAGTADMVVFAQKYAMHGWFDIKTGVNWRYAVLSFDSIIARSVGNTSIVSFLLGGDNMTAFFMATDTNASFTTNLATNSTFTLALGQLWGSEITVGKASMWKLVGQLLTCSIPNTSYYANIIMTISLWSMIAYVAVKMVSSFIPTIPGL